MASKKLTVQDREFIVKALMKKFVDARTKLKEDFGKLILDPFIKKNTPAKIFEFDKEFPSLIKKKESISLYEFYSKDIGNCSRYDTVPVKGYFPEYKIDFSEIEALPATEAFIKSMIENANRINEMKKMLTQALSEINTTKQLKDNFPEAYAIYAKENGVVDCKLENIRAQLYI